MSPSSRSRQSRWITAGVMKSLKWLAKFSSVGTIAAAHIILRASPAICSEVSQVRIWDRYVPYRARPVSLRITDTKTVLSMEHGQYQMQESQTSPLTIVVERGNQNRHATHLSDSNALHNEGNDMNARRESSLPSNVFMSWITCSTSLGFASYSDWSGQFQPTLQ